MTAGLTASPAQSLISPSSAQNPYYGSITMGTVSPETLHLSLDDAIQRGIQANLGLAVARVQQQQSDAQRLESLDPLLPSIKAEGATGAHQYNLATFGFNPGILRQHAPLFPGVNLASFSTIVKVDVTTADAALDWTAGDLAAYTRYRAAKESLKAAYYNTQSSRGLVVLNVGNQYLQTLADQSQIDSSEALLRADEVLLKQAQAEHEAGTAARLDELRARVQYQTQQQKVIAAQNLYEKDKILLKREIGVPVEQAIQLSDTAPYADLEQMSIEDARHMAYESRQDYQGMQRQVSSARLSRSAAHYERFPTLTASGNYGFTAVTHGLYHGTFVAMGELQIPLFKEAQFRGDADVAEAQQAETLNRMADLKQQIDQQLRDSMLDLNSSQALVRVSQQNVDLATRALSDANDRFSAGVDDNLPVVQAQATLSQAQSQLISDTLSYNQAKLGLARNLGIVDTQYKTYLHGK
ncbi:MAG TPA: TolC family protein [Acidobacteriaceae bacterium]|nr:TolC family protein [Acidobacteriaceae bacterium]